MRIVTNIKSLSIKCLPLPYKESKAIANKMILFLLSHKNIAKHSVGLACNQLGLDGRVIIIRNKNRWDIYINPILCKSSDEKSTLDEECLSLPHESFPIERNLKVRIVDDMQRARDPEKDFTDFEGFQARVIQHEIDHLDGILVSERYYKQNSKEI